MQVKNRRNEKNLREMNLSIFTQLYESFVKYSTQLNESFVKYLSNFIEHNDR